MSNGSQHSGTVSGMTVGTDFHQIQFYNNSPSPPRSHHSVTQLQTLQLEGPLQTAITPPPLSNEPEVTTTPAVSWAEIVRRLPRQPPTPPQSLPRSRDSTLSIVIPVVDRPIPKELSSPSQQSTQQPALQLTPPQLRRRGSFPWAIGPTVFPSLGKLDDCREFLNATRTFLTCFLRRPPQYISVRTENVIRSYRYKCSEILTTTFDFSSIECSERCQAVCDWEPLIREMKLDLQWRKRIEEYQMMRFHNYLLTYGEQIPGTQATVRPRLAHLGLPLKYAGKDWNQVLSEFGSLYDEIQSNDGRSRHITVSDSVVVAALRACGEEDKAEVYDTILEYCRRIEFQSRTMDSTERGLWKDVWSAGELIGKGHYPRVAANILRDYMDLEKMVPDTLKADVRLFKSELKSCRQSWFSTIRTHTHESGRSSVDICLPCPRYLEAQEYQAKRVEARVNEMRARQEYISRTRYYYPSKESALQDLFDNEKANLQANEDNLERIRTLKAELGWKERYLGVLENWVREPVAHLKDLRWRITALELAEQW